MLSPEDLLIKAQRAKTGRGRATFATRALAMEELDPTTHTMLLHQLYVAQYEAGSLEDAYRTAQQAIELDVMVDVMHQDAARALQGLGRLDDAAGHLRLAARRGPAPRRAFHWWTLGSIWYVGGRFAEAARALKRAARWGTTDKPLFNGHLVLARLGAGEQVRSIRKVYEALQDAPSGQGYGLLILGLLAVKLGEKDEARRYLSAFITRNANGRAVMARALAPELNLAQEQLSHLGRSN